MKTITVIQPSKTEKKMLRVAAYCRVSSSSEDQLHSFKAQNAYYRALITSNDDWTLADIYADEGITGTSAEKRPEFQRLMGDCRKGKIDLVLAKSISRFARNTKDCIEALRELKKLNIAVRFEKEGIDTSNDSGEMLITMMSAMAQEESISISQNMRWSYQKRMQAGTFITCSAPIGYDLVDGKLVVNMYCEDATLADIALYLASDSIPYGNDCDWNKMRVKRIVENEKYTGTEEYPRIVPDELFEKAVQMREYKAKRYGRRKPDIADDSQPVKTSFIICPSLKKHPVKTIDDIYAAAQSRYSEIQSTEISEE